MIQLPTSTSESSKSDIGKPFPARPDAQLELAIEAVFRSWIIAERADSYRRIETISATSGTAVNCQSMVFGNMGDDSGTGVAFTRDPATGEKRLMVETANAQVLGVGVVALQLVGAIRWNSS